MDNYSIDYIMRKWKCYKGTYSRDNLPLKIFKDRPIAFIINTDPSYKSGEHWVALFISKTNIAEYMDSFGFDPICCRIKKFCKLNRVKCMQINKFHIQNIFSDNCGRYCILFIQMRCKNITFNEFLKLFNNNTMFNELIIEYLV